MRTKRKVNNLGDKETRDDGPIGVTEDMLVGDDFLTGKDHPFRGQRRLLDDSQVTPDM